MTCGKNPCDAYIIGNLLTLSAVFTVNLTGSLVDPTDVILTIWNPDGEVETFTYMNSQIVKNSTGNYSYNYQPLYPGEYSYNFTGTGVAPAANSGTFNVAPALSL